MIAIDETEVFVRGEALGDIWWRGKQWAVTDRGIECLDGTYFIDKKRLMEENDGWHWVRQLAEKSWCDANEFATAYMVGLVLHGYSEEDPDSLRHHLSKMGSDD
ncbi:hypothetical protein ACT6QG_02145 [Xanthobacter sp. TB0136]|uniref:hypothetical protein n=1 Tax=Xanthobacter sp. TB0136 TaxID=3459177 RepID=UPI004039B10F